MIRSALLVASILCGLTFAPAHAGQVFRLAQATPAQPASPVPAEQPPAPASQPDQPAADASQAAADEPAGNVAILKGTATVTRNGMTGPLKLQDDIYKGDVLQTGKGSTLGVTFTDDTTLNLSESSRVAVDNFIYQDGARDNAALINVTRGTMAFVAAAVAKTGDMKIETPTATLGIRGTTGVVEVPEDVAPGIASASNVGVKLYPDADGKVGRIEVRARDGAPLGMLTQAASGFTVRGVMVRGFGMRMAAMPMAMSAQMIARDRSFMQRVHRMQDIGRRIVMQQRNFRMRNPNRPPAFGRPGYQGGPQRGRFNQPGQRQQPGRPGRPDLYRPGQPGQRSNLQPGMPGGLQRPSAVREAPPMRGPAGIPNRLGVPGRLGAPQVPALRMPSALPRPGQPGIPAMQKKRPQTPRDKLHPRNLR